jgi:hypothetical protein
MATLDIARDSCSCQFCGAVAMRRHPCRNDVYAWQRPPI